jgi:RHS repeat-associated protein
VETQCFGYDGLSRLTQAWTSTDNCADDPAKTGNSTVGGPQPYWQSWTYDQLGDIQSQTSYAPAGSTAGNNTTSYGYGVSGHVHAIASTTTTNSVTGASTTTGYAYNPDGETTSLGSQSLTWNDNGTLATVGNTSYVYDADGNELTQTTPSGATLFLPGEEISTGSTGTTGVRYYTFDGKTIALSTGTTLDWTEANPQGTLTAAVNAFPNPTGTQFIPIYRTLTPYGTVLTGSGEGTWPDNRTFLNDTDNTTTGLIDIGARKYNPATATFISVDPLLDTSNPQTMTGYTYSADDPINSEDPSGEYAAGPSHDGGYCEGSAQYCSGVSSRQQQANQQQYNQVSSAIENQDLEDCGCHFATQQAMASEWQSPAFAAQMVANYVATVEYDQRILAQAEAREEAQQQAQSHHNWFAAGLLALGAVALTVVNAVQLGADPLTDSAEAIDVGALVDTVVDDDTTVADDGADDPVEQGCGESFTAGTKVLLASGAAIPISRLRPGEKVLATNTRTGKTAPETVTAVMEKRDTDRYDLTIRSGPRTAVIDTTRNHLFWDVSQDRWVQAGALKNGNHLRTPDGATATVAGGHAPADTAGSMWDLSVPGGGDHDFYIDVIHTAVLVHNCPAFKSKYPFPKLQQCVISGLTILHLMNPATTAHGEMVLGNPPSYSLEIDNENPAPGTGAPPVPGGDGDGGGSGDGGEC